MPRIDLLLARNLGLSRKQVVRALREGRFATPDGRRIDDPRMPWPPSSLPAQILFGDELHMLHHRAGVLMHKPCGVVTALRDDRHPTAFSLLQNVPLRAELRAIGRLDLDTSGLLLWTTDGTLLHRLTHPRYAVVRTYQAALQGPFAPVPTDFALDDGHVPRIVELRTLDPSERHPAWAHESPAATWATITIIGGRFHEVRRIFAALGTVVTGLCRTAYGPIELPSDLPAGNVREIDLHEVFRGLCPELPDSG